MKEKAGKVKLIKSNLEERVQWNRERAALEEVNKKLAKMLEQVSSKINSIKEVID